MLAARAIEITGTDDGEGDSRSIRIVARPAALAFDSIESLGGGVDYHRLQADGQLFVRVETGGSGDQAWAGSPIDALSYFAAAFTFHGRLFDDLSVLVRVLDAVGFSATLVSAPSVDGVAATGYRLTAPVASVLTALVDLGLERADAAEADHASGSFVLTIWVGEILVGLDADGVYLHDTEAIDGSIHLRYRVLSDAEAPEVTAPVG